MEIMISESVTSLERIRCWFGIGLGDGFEGVRVVFFCFFWGGGYSLVEVRLGGGLRVVTTVGGVLCRRIIPSQLLLFAFSHYSSPSISACFFAIIPLIFFSAGSPTILSLLYPSPGVCTFWSSWGEGGTPPCEYPLAFGNIPLMVFFGAHPFTNPGIPILHLCVLNSPLFPYRYPNVFHARFAPCSLLCMLLSTNKCPNLPLSLALQYLSTSNRERNIPPNVPPFTIVQLAEMSIL